MTSMDALAIVIEAPETLSLRSLQLADATDADVVVEVGFSGVSAGTERLLWTGRMPDFPGMGYPLVPGYETVGTIVAAGPQSGRRVGEHVFAPGSRGFVGARGLFGGAASHIVVPGARTVAVEPEWGADATLLALAATAIHAIGGPDREPPDLIVGHGALGRLIARVALARGGAPVVWEANPIRREGAAGYRVVDSQEDPRRDYRAICDVSGDAGLIDALVGRLAPGGEIILAGFYHAPISFDFAPAFQREARLRVAAEWRAPDLAEAKAMIADGRLRLDGLITHRAPIAEAQAAYRAAFNDVTCLKMILDWRAGA